MPRPVKTLIEELTKLGAKSKDDYIPEDRGIFAEMREATILGLIRCAERGEDG